MPEQIWRDSDGCWWRRNPQVPDAWQIYVSVTSSWSDCELEDDDGPLEAVHVAGYDGPMTYPAGAVQQ